MAGKNRSPHGKHKKTCSACDKIKEVASKRYCRSCHNSKMREWRKTHTVSKEQMRRSKIRRATLMRIRRGSLIKQPCEVCGDTNVQVHHNNYNEVDRGKNFDIKFLCKDHHLHLHQMEKQNG